MRDYQHIDVDMLMTLADTGAAKPDYSIVYELAGIFLNSTGATMEALELAQRDGSEERIRQCVHDMKGTAGTFGARPLQQVFDAYENDLRGGVATADLAHHLTAAQAEYAALIEELKQLRAELQGKLGLNGGEKKR